MAYTWRPRARIDVILCVIPYVALTMSLQYSTQIHPLQVVMQQQQAIRLWVLCLPRLIPILRAAAVFHSPTRNARYLLEL